MKQFDPRKEVERVRKMYANNVGVHDKMDMKTFAIEFYGNWLKQHQQCLDFWKSEKPAKYMPKKVVVKIHRPKQTTK